MIPLLAAGVSALGNLASGLFGQNEAENNRHAQEMQARRNEALQREFAQNSIQWKVADAEKAGVHPLYAMGASSHSFAPVSLGSTSGSPMGSAFSAMGQDVSRAMMAQGTTPERVSALTQAMDTLRLENASLQNDMLRSQIARLNQQGNPPLPSPIPNIVAGQAGGSVKVDPSKTESTAIGSPSQAAAVVPDVSYSETATGLAPVPSKSVKDLVEDITIPQLMWGLRNNILPIAGINQNPPARSPGENKIWVFHPALGEYQAVPKNSWWAKLLGRPSDLRR